MAFKTILCQAVLTAKGGLKDAHFMRYVASMCILFIDLQYAVQCFVYSPLLYSIWFLIQMNSSTFLVMQLKQLYHIWLLAKKV